MDRNGTKKRWTAALALAMLAGLPAASSAGGPPAPVSLVLARTVAAPGWHGGVALADFDGDGRLDAAVGRAGGGAVQVFRGDGRGGLTYRTEFSDEGIQPHVY